MRLIDADVLIKQCKPRGIADEVWKESNEYKQIINAPTIDAVEVVCCKDCKHRYGDECPMRHIEWVEYEDDGFVESDDIVHDNTMDDGYCSFGEREDGEA